MPNGDPRDLFLCRILTLMIHSYSLAILFIFLNTGTQLLTNSEDPDEMSHKAAFLQCLYIFLGQKNLLDQKCNIFRHLNPHENF